MVRTEKEGRQDKAGWKEGRKEGRKVVYFGSGSATGKGPERKQKRTERQHSAKRKQLCFIFIFCR